MRERSATSSSTPTGALDRERMRELVFADAAKKQPLEALLHPMIRARIERRIAGRAAAPYVVLVVPLLVESRRLSRALPSACWWSTARRSCRSRACGSAAACRRAEVRAHHGDAGQRATARLAAADDVIDNVGDIAALQRQVEALHAKYLALAAAADEVEFVLSA